MAPSVHNTIHDILFPASSAANTRRRTWTAANADRSAARDAVPGQDAPARSGHDKANGARRSRRPSGGREHRYSQPSDQRDLGHQDARSNRAGYPAVLYRVGASLRLPHAVAIAGGPHTGRSSKHLTGRGDQVWQCPTSGTLGLSPVARNEAPEQPNDGDRGDQVTRPRFQESPLKAHGSDQTSTPRGYIPARNRPARTSAAACPEYELLTWFFRANTGGATARRHNSAIPSTRTGYNGKAAAPPSPPPSIPST